MCCVKKVVIWYVQICLFVEGLFPVGIVTSDFLPILAEWLLSFMPGVKRVVKQFWVCIERSLWVVMRLHVEEGFFSSTFVLFVSKRVTSISDISVVNF